MYDAIEDFRELSRNAVEHHMRGGCTLAAFARFHKDHPGVELPTCGDERELTVAVLPFPVEAENQATLVFWDDRDRGREDE